MDALSRLSHDTDAEVAQNAVVALGEHSLAHHLYVLALKYVCPAIERAWAALKKALSVAGPKSGSNSNCQTCMRPLRVSWSQRH